MVAVGETVTDEPLNEPGIQVNVEVPVAVNVVEPPVQIDGADADAVTVGAAPTLIVIV